jgi:hypothetical protein
MRAVHRRGREHPRENLVQNQIHDLNQRTLRRVPTLLRAVHLQTRHHQQTETDRTLKNHKQHSSRRVTRHRNQFRQTTSPQNSRPNPQPPLPPNRPFNPRNLQTPPQLPPPPPPPTPPPNPLPHPPFPGTYAAFSESTQILSTAVPS